jgi:hypothetical protein
MLYPNVDRLVANGKKIFLNLPARLEIFKKQSSRPHPPPPPTSVITYCGTCLGGIVYYVENFQVFCFVVNELHRDDTFFIAVFQ